MVKPKISVIVPIFNAEEYLDRCVNSILSQTEPDFELLLINDCSTDNSAKLCDEYAKKDKRVKVIHLKENSGPSIARNTAIGKAQGEFITFIDSDDWVDLNYFEALYSTAKKTNSDVVSCTALWTRQNTPELAKINPNHTPDIILNREQALIRLFTDDGLFHAPWGKIYRTQLFSSNIRFPEKILLEDVLTTYKLIYKSNVVTITNSTIYYYYQGEKSITRGKFKSIYLESLPYLNSIKPDLGNPTGDLAEAIEYSKFSITIHLLNNMITDGGYRIQSRKLISELVLNQNKLLSNRFLPLRKKLMLQLLQSPTIYEYTRILYGKIRA